jgi:hypothetical protein
MKSQQSIRPLLCRHGSVFVVLWLQQLRRVTKQDSVRDFGTLLHPRTLVRQICEVSRLLLNVVEMYRKLVQLRKGKVFSIADLQDFSPVNWYKNPVSVRQKMYDVEP